MTTTTTSPPPTFQLREKIDLTDKESQIFELLLQVVSHFSLQTEIRVAGGWVRDKLLGRKCNDIDIALDKVMGTEFAEKINEYLSSLGKEKLSFNFIPSNPDQSKHLETAKMRFDGIEIDFVNLRSEEYSENNRIPKMEFGTAKEDAERRDLTINSLFYNINTGSVDDFTERGIADLRSGRIATPLAAKQTFLDDPLRVLRAIRFGARFGFILDEDLKVAASDNDVKAALAKKISKERIGAELDLMISGNQPVNAMTHIYELQLFSIIFDLPPKFEPAASEERLCVSYMDAAWRLVQLIGCSTFNDEKRRLSLYAALLLPFRKTVCRVKKNKTIPWVSHIFRNSLKLNLSDADTVVSLHNATEKFTSLIPFITSKSNEDTQIAEVDCKREVVDKSKLRMLIGLLLRELKDFWRAVLLLSMLLYPTDIACTDSQVKHFELDKRIALFETVESEIIKLGLEKVWVMKPLLNGTDIITVLQLKTGGPLIGQLLQKVIEWQLVHPSGTLEECIDWLRQTHSNCLGADTFPVRKRKVGHPLT